MSDLVVVFELIARVRTCCENARWNKRSARRVKTCVEAFEKVLERMRDKGTSENHKAAISDLRGALGEAEAILTRISGRSKVSAMRYAREDHKQLNDVEKRLAQASDVLQVNFHVSAEQHAGDFNEDLLELMKISSTDNHIMHTQTQVQIAKLTQMLKDHLDVNTLTEQLSEVSVAIDADDKVTAADVGVFAKEALVVGVKNYENSPLRNTLNDATDVAEKLKEMGFRVELSLDPTKSLFKKARDAFESRIGPGVLALVYFAGHGYSHDGDNFLLMRETPDEVDERDLSDTSIRVTHIREGIRSRQAAFAVLILDACRSVRVRSVTRDVNPGGLSEVMPIKFKLKHAGEVIAFSTAPGATASDRPCRENERNGVYTHFLLKHLAAEKPVIDMLEAVQHDVMRESAWNQEPWIHFRTGTARARRIQLAGIEWGVSGPDMVEPEIIVQPGEEKTLFDAAKDGDVALIKRLVDAGADIDEQDDDGNTVLHLLNDYDVINFVITAGARTDILNHTGHSCAYHAIVKDKAAAVKAFVDGGVLDIVRPMGERVALCFDMEGRPTIDVKLTPVLFAVIHAARDVLCYFKKELRVNFDATMDEVDDEYRPSSHPLFAMLIGANRELRDAPYAEFIFSAKPALALLDADPTIRTSALYFFDTLYERRSLDSAFTAVIARFGLRTENTQDEMQLFDASHRCDVELIKELVDSGCDINAYCVQGPLHTTYTTCHTALDFAARAHQVGSKRQLATLRALVGMGATECHDFARTSEKLHQLVKSLDGFHNPKNIDTTMMNACDSILVKLLEKESHYHRRPLIHLATHIRQIEILSAYGADMNSRDTNGQTRLHFEAFSTTYCNTEMMKELVKCGADVDAVDENDATPLHTAARHDNVAAIRCLVNECKANVEAGEKSGATPLHLAASNNSVAAIRCLANECKANVEADNECCETPLHLAAGRDNVAAIRCLVNECKANVEAGEKSGATPLHLAAAINSVAAIRCLVSECKANVEAGHKNGETPLHTAAVRDNVAAIRCLVSECKANVEAGENNGATPLHLAALEDKVAAIRCLVNECKANVEADNKYCDTPLHLAARHDNVAAIRCLVNECKANVEAGTKNGETPLHCAASYNSVAAIRCLVNECKANVEAGNNDGETPLRWAAGCDNVAAIRCLVNECKANVEAVTKNGATPLHLAAANNSVAAIRCLVSECKANVEADNKFCETPLHTAAGCDNVAAIRCLVNECKANVEAGDNDGTPLRWAAAHDSVAAIRCLVNECKANVEAGDNDGGTPLHLAAVNNSVAAIRCLVSECKANVEAGEKNGETPLHIAAGRDNVAAIWCLVNECKANVEAGEKNGETPLHIAAGRDNVAAIRRLVNECKANVEANSRFGTPLQRATKEETKQVLRELGAKT